MRAREEIKILCLKCFLFCYFIFLIINNARSADLGAGYSKGSTGSIQKNYNVSFGVTQKISVALYAADSLQHSDDSSVDNKATSYKGSFIYKPNPNLRYAIAYKRIDDYNEYKGDSYSAKVTVKSKAKSGKYFGSTKLSLSAQDDRMKYTKLESEKYEKIAISIGLSQVLAEYFIIGVDYSKNAFLPQGTSTISAFKNKTISDENISDTVDGLSDSAVGGYIEYNDLSFWSIGAGYSQSKDLQNKKDASKSVEAYADVEIGDNLTISPSYSVTRSKSSSTPKTSTVALNISISFL